MAVRITLREWRSPLSTALSDVPSRRGAAMDARIPRIITTTTSGQTARLISKYRPRFPILCATWNSFTHCQMSVVWGVEAIHMALPQSTDEQIENAINAFVASKRLKVGDTVVVSAGVPAGKPGNTNLIMVRKAGQG